MTGGDAPTAVLRSNDMRAAGAFSMAQKRGIRAPDDLSLTGFNNIGIAEIGTRVAIVNQAAASATRKPPGLAGGLRPDPRPGIVRS